VWNGYFIPKGSAIYFNIGFVFHFVPRNESDLDVSSSFMMRDPRIWGEDAEFFKPERFLPEYNPKAGNLPDMGSLPFGFGLRYALCQSPCTPPDPGTAESARDDTLRKESPCSLWWPHYLVSRSNQSTARWYPHLTSSTKTPLFGAFCDPGVPIQPHLIWHSQATQQPAVPIQASSGVPIRHELTDRPTLIPVSMIIPTPTRTCVHDPFVPLYQLVLLYIKESTQPEEFDRYIFKGLASFKVDNNWRIFLWSL
jgi:hypothetical protein